MKDKLNRAVATGLLALMIANFSACDKFGDLNHSTDTSQIGNEQTTISEVNTSGPQGGIFKPKDLPGDIWKTLKANGKAYADYESGVLQLDSLAIPIRFLQEEGLLYYDDSNILRINGKQLSIDYTPLFSNVFVDENSPENDVYVLLNYKSDIMKYDIDEDVYVTTWKLKYTLDDDDYQALLMLKDDFRQRFFIQEMDNVYEPEVITKTTSAQRYIASNSPFLNEYSVKNVFPKVYIANIDYETYTITMAAQSDKGYKFYDVNLYETNAIERVMERYRCTREEALEMINVKTKETILGPCLTKFHVSDCLSALDFSELERRFNESTREHELTNLDSNSVDNKFIASK